jgi:hypothetical protein
MAGTEISSSVPVEELPDGFAAELNGGDPEGGADAATEARARDMGWKPLAEYRGPPGRWQPAADFISRGENILPIVRDQNRRMTERIGKLEGEVTGLRTTAAEQLQIIKDLRDMGQRANQAGYDRAMSDIRSKQRQAVESGDTKAYDQLVEQAEALASGRPNAVPPAPATPAVAPPDAPARPTMSAAVQTFVSQNPWWNQDPFLTRKMIDQHTDVIQEGELLDEAAQLAEAKQRLMDAYPDRFGMPQTPQPAAQRPQRPRRASVATPTPDAPPVRPGAAPTINSIPDPGERSLAREAFNRMKRQLPDYTEAEYMALYDDPHADILVEQQKRKAQPNGR